MSNINWRVYGQDTIACLLDRAQIPGLAKSINKKEISFMPDEAGAVIRNGLVEEIMTQNSLTVSSFWGSLGDIFGVTSGRDLNILFFDITPFDIRHEFTVVTDTKETMHIEAMLRLKVDINNAIGIMGLLKGKTAVSKYHLFERIKDELMSKVILPRLQFKSIESIRLDKELISRMQQEITGELRKSLAAWGLVLETFVFNCGLTLEETQEILLHKLETEQKILEFQHNIKVRDTERKAFLTRLEISNVQELSSLEANNQHELKMIYLSASNAEQKLESEGRIDGAKTGAYLKVLEARAEQQLKLLELETDKSRRLTDFEIEKLKDMHSLEVEKQAEEHRLEIRMREIQANIDAAIKKSDAETREMWEMTRMQLEMRRAKYEREQQAQKANLEHEYRQRRTKLEETLARLQMQMQIVSQAIAAGVADPSVIRTMLEESTMQEYATTTDARVQSLTGAKAAQFNMNTYKEAEDRERINQESMSGQAAALMGAARKASGGASEPAVSRRQEISKKLDKLEDRFLDGHISENTYLELKAKLHKDLEDQ